MLPSLFDERLAPASCRWCEDNALDAGVRDALRWSDPGAARTGSNLAAFAAVPAATLGLSVGAAAADGRLSATPIDALIVAESVALAGAANQAFKFTVGRRRPFAHALAPEERAARDHPDDNLSFYSGHTSFAFSLAVSSGTVATLRGYRLAPLVWAAGLPAAAAAGWLRIAADMHYFTDVLAGAAMGSAFGFGVPYLLHRPRGGGGGGTVPLAVNVRGHALIVSGAW